MIFSVLSFLAGIISAQQLVVLPNSNQIFILLVLLVCLVWLSYWRLMWLVTGMLWAVIFAMIQMSQILPEQLQGREIIVKGFIDGLPEQEGNRTKFDFVVDRPQHELPKKIRLSWYFPRADIKAGQYWQLTVKLKQPHGLFNPGGFDYERGLFSQNIGAVGYVRSHPAPRLLEGKRFKQLFSIVRQSIADRLDQILAESQYIGIIKALTIGERSAMTSTAWEVLRKTGTVHLVAISGLHIGLVAGLVYFLGVKVWAYSGVLSRSPQQVAAVCALAAAFGYAALAGFALPTRRALIMLTVAMLALYRQRHITPFKTLAIALLVVVTLDPLSVLSASFWMSFMAVLLIVYTQSARLGRLGFWRSLLKIHWVTAVGLAPLIMFYFQQVSLVAPLANLLAVPVVGLLLVPLSLLAILLLFMLPTWAEQLLFLVDWILQILWPMLAAGSAQPFAAVATAQPPVYAVMLALMGVFLLLAPKGIPGRYLGLLLCLPVVFVRLDRPVSGESRMTLLDVGQGLSAVVETRNHVLVFDSGAKFSDRFDMGSAVVLPYLRFRGIKMIDTLLISHGDNDHIGGAGSILAMMPVRQVISNAAHLLAQHHARVCRSGKHWEWDGVRFSLLSPPEPDYFQHENDNSCVLKVSTSQQDFLLTGDIEQTAEQWLVEKHSNALVSDIMIAPHHGSNTSSSIRFLEQVDPAVVLIPAGYRNRFSFPHRQVLQRFQERNIRWFNSSEEGAIIVTTDREQLLIQSSRETDRKYWFPR